MLANEIEMVIEEERVSIASAGGVRVAYPVGMNKVDLGLVLQGMGMHLIRGGLANGNGNENRIREHLDDLDPKPKVQKPQDKNRRTLEDRRGCPRRKITKRSRSGKREELECGHVIEPVPSNWKRHKSRACSECAPVASS